MIPIETIKELIDKRDFQQNFYDEEATAYYTLSQKELQAFANAIEAMTIDRFELVGSCEAIVDDNVLKHIAKLLPITTPLYRRKD